MQLVVIRMGPLKALNFLPLLPPGVAVVAHKVGILFKGRVVVGRQHFRVGVHVNPSTLGLFQQHLQIPQIVAGDQNAGPLVAHPNLTLVISGWP